MNLMDTDRKGFCAMRITASAHEWTWTQEEQEEMAQTILDLDGALEESEAENERLRKMPLRWEIYNSRGRLQARVGAEDNAKRILALATEHGMEIRDRDEA